MTLIQCKDLSLSYNGINVVSNLNFIVKEGDYLCIVGENGSGKSTLMKALLGLKSPTCGTIDFLDNFNKTDIGYLPQKTGIQKDFPASVYEVILSGFASKEKSFFYSKQYKNRAKEIMRKLAISDISNRSFKELSGGQQQRVLLARALCATNKLIVLDEPVSGLDPQSTAQLYDIIYELNQNGIAVIMVSHDVLSAIKYASHILHIGKPSIFFGNKEDYLNSEISKHYIYNKGEPFNV